MEMCQAHRTFFEIFKQVSRFLSRIPQFLVFAILLFDMTPRVAHAENSETWRVGEWDVISYEMELCSASIFFRDQTYVIVTLANFENKPVASLRIGNPGWQSIADGQFFNVELAFDDMPPDDYRMMGSHAIGTPSLYRSWPTAENYDDPLIEALMASFDMKWAIGGQRIGVFSLKGSRRAIEAAIACQMRKHPPAIQALPNRSFNPFR